MPELPEVQIMVDDLKKRIIGRTILAAWSDWPKIIKFPKKFSDFADQIKNSKIINVARRAKYIEIHLNNDRILMIHPRMTGHPLLGHWEIKNGKAIPTSTGAIQDKINGYVHLLFYLDNDLMLGISDARKFCTVRLGKKSLLENLPEIKKLGIDPFDKKLTVNKVATLLRSKKRPIKPTLLDQTLISGIGNIYADEILWLAKIHPLRKTNSLTDTEIKSLFKAMRLILKKALLLRGSSFVDYRDTNGEKGRYSSVANVYNRKGEPCKRCNSKIIRIKIAQRSAHFCEQCQK